MDESKPPQASSRPAIFTPENAKASKAACCGLGGFPATRVSLRLSVFGLHSGKRLSGIRPSLEFVKPLQVCACCAPAARCLETSQNSIKTQLNAKNLDKPSAHTVRTAEYSRCVLVMLRIQRTSRCKKMQIHWNKFREEFKRCKFIGTNSSFQISLRLKPYGSTTRLATKDFRSPRLARCNLDK